MDSARSNQVRGISPPASEHEAVLHALLKAQTQFIIMQNAEIDRLREQLRKLCQKKKSWWCWHLDGWS